MKSPERSKMEIERNSMGDYVCPICKREFYTKEEAEECLKSHKDLQNEVVTTAIAETSMHELDIIREKIKAGKTADAGGDLLINLIEDYKISRHRDLMKKGTVGPMTMQLGKNAMEAMNTYNKVVFGEKSLRINANIGENNKKSDIDAIKQLLKKRGKVIDVDEDGKDK